MLEKSLQLTPDAYVPDLEDAVPPNEKDRARDLVASFLPRMAATGTPVIPRLNAAGTGLLKADLEAVVGPHVYGVSVGKAGDRQAVKQISRMLSDAETTAGLEPGRVKLLPWIETALGVVNAYDICTASPRVMAVAFGAEDYTNDMAIERTEHGMELDYPRSAVGVAARAAGVLALDTPYVLLRDQEGLERDCQRAKSHGFGGKFAIHPEQVEIINRAFTPSPAQIAHARRVIDTFEEANRSGRGTTSLDGEVIDIPVVRRASKLLQLAGVSHGGGAASR